jgi:hypothetical protein
MKGFRVEQRFTIAAEDLAEAMKRWEILNEEAESIGFLPECGALGEMKPSEVIPGSPLAKHMEAAR